MRGRESCGGKFSCMWCKPVVSSLLSFFAQLHLFIDILRTMSTGMPLDEDDIYLLADATDLTPFAEFVSPHEALLSPLKEKAQGAAPGTGFRAALTVRQEQGEQGKAFAVRHFRSQLAKAALQQKRTPLQWQADVYSVFTGFDRGGGFVTGTDFKAALNILGVNMSYDLLASLVPRGSVAFGSVDMIHFEQVLSDVFDESSLSESVAGSSGRMLADLETSGTDQRRIRPALGGPSHLSTAHKQRPVEQTDLPKRASNAVKALVSVVRRGMEKFIVNGSDIEDVSLANKFMHVQSSLTDVSVCRFVLILLVFSRNLIRIRTV